MSHIISMCDIVVFSCQTIRGVRMKKGIKILLATALLSCGFGNKNIVLAENLQDEGDCQAVAVSMTANVDLETHAKAAYLMDFYTKTVIYAHE